MSEGFGSCCKDLAAAMRMPPSSLFRVEQGVLYLAVGYATTEHGTGWFEEAVLFCPFCGRPLQDRDTIRKQVGDPGH